MSGDAVDLLGLRVLLVEDEDLIAMMEEEFLNDLGCRVMGTAGQLDEALIMARSLEIDAAVLDVNLGGWMSYPVAEALQARGIPFVFATGYGTAGLPESLHTAPVLSKPFKTEQLGAALRQATRRA